MNRLHSAIAVLLLFLTMAGGPAWAERPQRFHENMRDVILHDAPSLVITNVRVVDGTGAPAQEGMTVRIANGRIESIRGADRRKLKAEVRIDGTGKTLLPGYVMVHEHLFYQDVTALPLMAFISEAVNFSALYLAGGATTIRTAGTMHPIDDLQVRRLIQKGVIPGPDIFVTAPYIDGPNDFFHQMVQVTTPDDAREFVRHWVAAGATSFKAYVHLQPDVLAAVIDEAHRHKASVTGHVCAVTFAEAAALGIDNLEHGLFAASDLAGAAKEPGECKHMSWSELAPRMDLESPVVRSLIEVLVKHRIAITSTLPVLFPGYDPVIPSQEALELLSPRSREVVERVLGQVRSRHEKAGGELPAMLQKEMAFEKALVDAGGHLVVGTDPTGWGATLPPNSTHAALILLVRAGFTPLEAIQLATQSGARFLGIEKDVGTIAPGKRANLILVEGAPDQDIGQVRHAVMVLRDGVAYNPNALIARARGKIGR